jgi:D-glycero-alpha-D-manno-heptose 1-phosphate guanylyltransferase
MLVMIMQSIILASGYNTRVQHLFPHLPKVMFPLDEKPYLAYWLDMLLVQQTDVIILAQYHATVIKKYIQENYPEELKNGNIRIIDRPEHLGPVRAVAGLKDIIPRDFAIFYCDILFRVDLADAEKRLGDKFLGLTFVTKDEFHMFGNMEVRIDNQTGLVTHFQPDEFERAEGLMDVGQIYKKEALDLFLKAPEMAEHFNKETWQNLIAEKKLTYYAVGPVFDIGTEKNYNTTKEIFAREGLKALDMAGPSLSPQR